jgi:hypothetical protein
MIKMAFGRGWPFPIGLFGKKNWPFGLPPEVGF